MADKDVKIRIDTEANTQGAKEAEKSLKQVEEAVEDVSERVGEAHQQSNSKPPIAPEAVKKSLGSIREMEETLARLKDRLRDAALGGEDFTRLSTEIGRTEKKLQEAHDSSRKLAGTIGRRGNAGAAVLEFSRAFEDAQYGIRGVLNNLPGLIAMLGGGAGLAGVISILAVAGVQLWEKMQQGPKDSTKAAEEYLDVLKEIAKRMGEEDRGVLELRKQADDERMESLRNQQALQERISNAEVNREKSRIKADGNLEVARLRLTLATTEKQLATSTGETAVRLAKEREETLKRILEKEREIAEQVRQQDVKAAQVKVDQAQDTVEGATELRLKWYEAVNKETQRREELEKIIAQEAANRRQLIEETQEQIQKTRQDASLFNQDKSGELSRLEKQEQDLQKPTNRESEASEKLAQQLETIKDARENSKETAKQLEEAERKLRVATSDLEQLRANQAQERKTEVDQSNFNNQSDFVTGKQQVADDLAKKVGDFIEGIDLPSPEQNSGVRFFLDQLTKLAEGGLDETERGAAEAAVQKLIGLSNSDSASKTALISQLASVFEAGNKADAKVAEMFEKQSRINDEYRRRLDNIEGNLGNPNH